MICSPDLARVPSERLKCSQRSLRAAKGNRSVSRHRRIEPERHKSRPALLAHSPGYAVLSVMPSSSINNPEHWLQRAQQMRTLAEGVMDDVAKVEMLRTAEGYEKLAKRAEARSNGIPQDPAQTIPPAC